MEYKIIKLTSLVSVDFYIFHRINGDDRQNDSVIVIDTPLVLKVKLGVLYVNCIERRARRIPNIRSQILSDITYYFRV